MSRSAAADEGGVPSHAAPVLAALQRGIPLTLLLDLAEPSGPDSARILATETADLSWMTGLAFPATPVIDEAATA